MIDNPAPIKSQVNPLDPDGGVGPEWFVQHEGIFNCLSFPFFLILNRLLLSIE